MTNAKGPNSMNRIALLAILAAALGCSAKEPPPQPGGRLGSVNNYNQIPCETVALTSSTTTSAARSTLGFDTLSYVIVTTGTWSGTYTLQASNDNSTWFTVTLPNAPAASTGSPQTTPIDWEGGWSWAFARLAFVGSGSTGTATVCPVLKG